MAEAQDAGPPSSIAARIAALNLNQIARQPTSPPPSYDQAIATKRAAPPPLPPKRPQVEHRSQTTNNPPLQTHTSFAQRAIVNQPTADNTRPLQPPPVTKYTARVSEQKPELPQRPSLPPRPSQTSNGRAPTLPPRKPSIPSLRHRESQESIASTRSARSTYSTQSNGTSLSARTSLSDGTARSVKAPAYDPATLPPLPEKKTNVDKESPRVPPRSAYSSPVTASRTNGQAPELPSRGAKAPPPETNRRGIEPPPSLPSRPALPSRQNSTAPQLATRATPKRSALDFGMNKSTEAAPALPRRPGSEPPPSDGIPPPIPTSSRPDLAALQASKPKPGAASERGDCLHCRDFSTVDAHAARFRRESLPSLDMQWLGQQLCSPFPSATDKARAIFTFLHHNIEYNTVAFFNNNVQPSTPASTLATGLAVCEGYAGLFAALAIAAGLEAVVVVGYGKGFGYTTLQPGERVPPFKSNHTWNAVRIDNGQWKVIDPCWGAGAVNGANQPYIKRFAPEMFTMDNAEIGLRHFPTDQSHWYAPPMTWEEFMLADGYEEPLKPFGCEEHGLSERSFQPSTKKVSKNPSLGPTVRFSFSKVCRHWDSVQAGKGVPMLLVLRIGEGEKEQDIPFHHDGYFWWMDVNRSELGVKGRTIWVYAVDTWMGKDARGLTADEFTRGYGKPGFSISFKGVATWTVD